MPVVTVLSRCLIVMLLLVVLPSARADRVWGEAGLATMYAGQLADGTVREKLMLAALGPDVVRPSQFHDRFAVCLRDAVVALVQVDPIWVALDKTKTPSSLGEELQTLGQPITPQAVSAARDARLNALRQIFGAARTRFHAALQGCDVPASMLAQVRLAVVNRVCRENSARSCTGEDYLHDRANLSADRYVKIFEWFQSAGIREENEFLLLLGSGALQPVAVQHELYAGKDWPAPMSARDRQLAFEGGAKKLRAAKLKYDTIAPQVLGIAKDTAYRLADVIDHPTISLPVLRDAETGAPALLSMSDEIARSRITECKLFFGRDDLSNLEKCSGYQLTQTQFQACMTGARCVPAFSDTGYAAVMEHVAVRSGSEFLSTSLSRLDSSLRTWDQVKAAAKACNTGAPQEKAVCLTSAGLSGNDKTIFDCSSAAVRSKRGAVAVATCMGAHLPDANAKALVDCVGKDLNSHKAVAICGVKASLPPAVAAGVECIRSLSAKGKSAMLGCVAGASPDGAKAAACYDEHPKDWSAAALCFGADRTDLPKEAAQGIDCANSASDYKKFAGCMAAKNLDQVGIGGDGGKLIGCAVENGGNSLGTLSCMTGDSLTPEQKIALQCAAQSPDLVSFAVCSGGQLSVREFVKCQGHKFGDDTCFGPNNEIRKFLKAIGIDASSETVVGQYGNAILDFQKAQVAFAESAGREVIKVGEGVFRVAEGFAQAAVDVVSGLVSAGESVVHGLANALGL